MREIKLTKEQEEKWLGYIETDSEKFLVILLDRLKGYKDIKLIFSNDFLGALYLNNIEKDENKYSEVVNLEFPENRYKKMLLKYIDFENFTYQNLYLDQKSIDFLKEYNIVLDLDCIYNKDISALTINGMIVEGCFDGFNIKGCKITSNEGLSGNTIKINPQKVLNKNLCNCEISNVYFTDNFDDCIISSITLKDNMNTFINPKKTRDKDLSGCTIKDATFTDNFDGCDISFISLKNNSGVIINPQLIKDKNLQETNILGAKFTGPLDGCLLVNSYFDDIDGLWVNGKGIFRHRISGFYFINLDIRVDDYVDYNSLINAPFMSEMLDENVTIITNSEYYIKLKCNSLFKKCKFQIIHSQLENDIDEVLNTVNISDENVKEKKRRTKRLFKRFMK